MFFCTVEMASGRAAWCRNPDGMAGRFGATKPDGLPASRAWCLIARKPLFLRRRAPRRMGESEHGDGRRGASPPANPCFFVEGHHVGWANRSMGTNGVVPHRPPSLVSSSPGTTSHRLIRARGRIAWCLTARYPLFLRRRAPRRMGESEHGDGRRGASPPANPCFFVEGHHVGWANRSMGTNGVVPHRPPSLVSSSPGTTSHRLIRARGRIAWCLTARYPLFLRRRAPRRMGESEHGDGRRGASPPASPCFFVAGHHAPDFLQPDNSGNPPRVPGIPISPKKTKIVGKVLLPQHLVDISLSPINQ